MVIAASAAVAMIITGIVVATSLKAAPKVTDGAQASSSVAQIETPPAPSAEEKIAVLVTVDPSDAQIGLADGKMQPQPVTVTLGANEEATLRIEKKGFISQNVTLKGSDIDPKAAWRVYVLKPDKSALAAKPPATSVKPSGAGTRSTGQGVLPAPPTVPAGPKPLVCPPGLKPDPFGRSCEKPLF
jgi:hypothetical protein